MSKMLQKLLLLLSLMIPFAMAWAVVDVNTATQAQLESIKGIGPVTAQKIIQERQNGPFRDANDLATRVKGIGSKSVQKLEANGLAVGGGVGGNVSSFFHRREETAPANTSTNTTADGSAGGGLTSFFHRKEKAAPANASSDMTADADNAAPTKSRKHHHKRKKHSSDSSAASQ